MTLHEEPPIVDLDELLSEQRDHEGRATRTQWVLVVVGGIVGIVGSLTLLVVTAPAWLQLIRIIGSLGAPADPGPTP